ncbi:MAG TPA: LamG-like jellyroll fold domain-containing protein, partial [Xanthobacteraceae bacterium]|nr:LamG-like jellyroll fold domain-containing protein [Xanthobacteraceae bacterium]
MLPGITPSLFGAVANGNDAFTTLLLHFDGTTSSKHAIDFSPMRHGHMFFSDGADVYPTGRFGPTTARFFGNGYCSTLNNSNPYGGFTLGTGDFTVDWWELRQDAADNRPSFVWDGHQLTYQPLLVGWSAGGQRYFFAASGAVANWDVVNNMPLGSIDVNAWTHLAIVRKGNTFYGFKNGVLTATASSALAIRPTTTGPMLGLWQQDPGSGNYYLYGFIDEFRVSKGVARWVANFTPPAAPYGPDPTGLETVLLVHADGTEGSTSFPDASRHDQLEGTSTKPTVNTTVKKFGTGSMNFPGGSTALLYGHSEDFEFGTGDFTIDWQERRASTGNAYCVAARDTITTYVPWLIHSVGGRCVFYATSDGANWNIANNVDMGPLTANVWTHRAITRKAGTYRFFQDGVLQGSFTNGAQIVANANPLSIGYAQSGAIQFVGQIDEFRIVKGVAAWTQNFAPPLAPYDPAAPVVAPPDPYATSFVVTAPASCVVGTAFNFTVQARAGGANTTNYTGIIHFTGTAGMTLPGDVSLINGVGTFSATATSAGTKTITATDTTTSSITGVSGNISATSISAGQVIISTSQTWTVPPNFNPANNSFEIFGAGGNGGAAANNGYD